MLRISSELFYPLTFKYPRGTMNFEFSEEQQFIRDQAANFLSQQCTPETVRSILETDKAYHDTLWQSVVDLGWTAMAIPEQYGGLGLGYLELCVIAEELGRVVAPIPFASSVYLATEAIKLAGSEEQKQHYLQQFGHSAEAINNQRQLTGYWRVTNFDAIFAYKKSPVSSL